MLHYPLEWYMDINSSIGNFLPVFKLISVNISCTAVITKAL